MFTLHVSYGVLVHVGQRTLITVNVHFIGGPCQLRLPDGAVPPGPL